MIRMPCGSYSLHQPSQLLQLVGSGNNKPSNLLVDSFLGQRLDLGDFPFDILWWIFGCVLFSVTALTHIVFYSGVVLLSVPKSSVLSRMKHPSLENWIFWWNWILFCCDESRYLGKFTKAAKRWKLSLELMQAKLVEIFLFVLCEFTLSFWQARVELLIEQILCWSSVD